MQRRSSSDGPRFRAENRMLSATSMALLTLMSGCATMNLNESQIGDPQPVTDWEGFNNIYHDGPFYFAGQPTSEALSETADRGIKTVINFRPDREMQARVDFDEPAVLEKLGITYKTLPVTGSTVNAENAAKLYAMLDESEGPILLHCGSSNRVGGIWAIYLNHHRKTPVDEAIRIGKLAGMRNPRLVEMVRNEAQ